MRRTGGGIPVVAAGLAWFLACLPSFLAFLVATVFPRAAQERALRRVLRAQATSGFGRRHGFADLTSAAAFARRLPLREYADLAPDVAALQHSGTWELTAEPVDVLQPTSGSTSAPKLIACTRSLRRDMQRAVAPWVVRLFLRQPGLLLGRHYWAVSPSTAPAAGASAVRVGFADDTEYLPPLGRRFATRLMAVPPAVQHVTDPEWFVTVTLLFLVRAPDLRLISVWHPSFLTGLLEALPTRRDRLVACLRAGRLPEQAPLAADLRAQLDRQLAPDLDRADLVDAVAGGHPDGWRRLWPHLRHISCWGGPEHAPWLAKLAAWFPEARLEAKGLLATEGVVSIPWYGGGAVAAVRSHALEFIALAAGETAPPAAAAEPVPLWELVAGGRYSVVLTTGGGLYRYRLHDVVEVTGHWLRLPVLRFRGRDNDTCDLAGEKLHPDLVREAVDAAALAVFGEPLAFGLVAPADTAPGAPPGYAVFAQRVPATGAAPTDAAAWEQFGVRVEEAFCGNYHYRHARALGQLTRLRVFVVERDAERLYRDELCRRGGRYGAVRLRVLERSPGWESVFAGGNGVAPGTRNSSPAREKTSGGSPRLRNVT